MPQFKPNITSLAELNASGARTVPESMRPYLDFLCRKYAEHPPFHFTDCLLADIKVPYCVQMDKPKSGENEGGTETKNDEGAESIRPPMFNRPGKKAIKWIANQAQSLKFVMTRVGKPDAWDKEVGLKNN